MNLSKDKLIVEEVIPYTRSSVNGKASSVLKQPLIVFSYGKMRFYMTGRRLLWSLLDRVVGLDYSRKTILDSLYHGPLEEFKEGLQHDIKNMKDKELVFNLCTQEEFKLHYSIYPMYDSYHTAHANIVKSVSVPSEEGLLLHLLNTMKDFDVPMVYDGVSGKVNHSRRITATVHEFSEDKHVNVTMRMRIVVNEKGTATIESWVQGDGWEASPLATVSKILEFDARYLGPALKRHYVSLSNLSSKCCRNVELMQTAWNRQEEVIRMKEKYGERIEKNTLMFYRHLVGREVDKSEAV